jgi:hypothetical protein
MFSPWVVGMSISVARSPMTCPFSRHEEIDAMCQCCVVGERVRRLMVKLRHGIHQAV